MVHSDSPATTFTYIGLHLLANKPETRCLRLSFRQPMEELWWHFRWWKLMCLWRRRSLHPGQCSCILTKHHGGCCLRYYGLLDSIELLVALFPVADRNMYICIQHWGHYACVASGQAGAQVNQSSISMAGRDFPHGTK